ncbi:MAG: hypothetical protein RLZZ168_583, partial [Cyanobacteriota bacterium]
MGSSDAIATWQILNTLVPYGLLWWLAVRTLAQGSWWLLLPVLALMVLFLARVFSLMHDCSHYSLFRNRHTNRWVGFLLGIVAGIPQLPWSRGHAFHHRHNGNWERYKGPSALVSVDTYAGYSDSGKAFYRWLRHPLMLFPGGFFYLVIKPRVELLAGLGGFLPHAWRQLRQSPRPSWAQIVAGGGGQLAAAQQLDRRQGLLADLQPGDGLRCGDLHLHLLRAAQLPWLLRPLQPQLERDGWGDGGHQRSGAAGGAELVFRRQRLPRNPPPVRGDPQLPPAGLPAAQRPPAAGREAPT